MVKFKKSNFTALSLQNLPTELLLLTFQEFDIPTLLNVCNVCKRFQQIGTKVLSEKFKEPKIGLILTFEQEYKWKSNVVFELHKFNEQSGKFIFKPKSKQSMRFIQSSMVRSPVLSKVTVTGISCSSDNNNNKTKVTNEPISSSATASFPFSPPSSQKLEKENFLQTSLTLNIKPSKDTLKKVRYVYRIGHGTTHLRIPYTFRYSVTNTPPSLMQKTRDGERWITPISFECAPSFFYPREPIAHKIIMTMIHLRKKNKKKTSFTSQRANYNRINFEEMDDFISIELNTNNQENLINANRNRLFEQEYLLFLKLKGTLTNKWSNGARR